MVTHTQKCLRERNHAGGPGPKNITQRGSKSAVTDPGRKIQRNRNHDAGPAHGPEVIREKGSTAVALALAQKSHRGSMVSVIAAQKHRQ